MTVHLLGRGEPPPGARAASLCGKLEKEDQLTRSVMHVTCSGCISIIKKNG